MKKLYAVLFLCAALSAPAWSQSGSKTGPGGTALPGDKTVPGTSAMAMVEISLLNLNTYANYFGGFKNGRTSVELDNYIFTAPRVERRGDWSNLGGEDGQIDTPLEFALLSYYSQPVINIRPVEADAILPKNDPKLAGLKLGSALLKELYEIKFLTPNDTAAIGRYEGKLKFVSDKNGVTRAEIDAYYHAGIKSLIAEAVDEQFNKISFVMSSPTGGYNAILTRNPQNGQYKLSYEDTKYITKEITAPSLNALLVEMGRRKTDFDQTSINQVRDQAALLPAVVYADWKTKGVANGVDALALVKEALVNFYTSPSRSTYEPLVGICARYYFNGGTIWGTFTEIATTAYLKTLSALAPALVGKIDNDVRKDERGALARTPNDDRYKVFSVRYGGNAYGAWH
jgi:hypothetical protein